ncbi:MAG: InlB B-repeat-containing protein [Spirochaetales bacterium]|nr:InlB B-repeat-containing protein [Spirochaetales bacterium]
MKKAFILLLTAFLFISLFISCGPEPILEIIVKYDGNGSTSGSMERQIVVKGESFELPENQFGRSDGYQFIGWNTKEDGTGESYPDGETVRFTEDTTLYAQWHLEVVKIYFKANGGTGKMIHQLARKGVDTTLRQNRFSKEGYFFTGWSTDPDGKGTWYSDADTAKFEADTTLYAQWYKEVVKITFISNGGGGLMFPQWVQKDVATNLKPNTFNWKGHYFTGWNTKPDGSGKKYNDKEKIKTNTAIVLYAQWIMDVSTMDDKTRWNGSDGKYFTISADVTIDERVEITGDITLILPEGKTLTANKGLNVSTDNALTIEGKGTLNATGGNGQAGIGGGNYESCGTVTIKDGTINATGGQSGAGIGGGRKEDKGGYGGTVNISGGNITAIGGDSAAGIGGANDASCGTVIVTGGTVKTTGGRCGAGIGGGYWGSGGNVTISGGTLTATGGFDAAGIGGGYLYDYDGAELVISGGTVTATGGSPTAAGIGGGSCGGVSGSPGKLTIGYDKIQSKSLVINSGWSLYYGDSENPTDHVDGKHNKDDLKDYAKQYMRVTKTTT